MRAPALEIKSLTKSFPQRELLRGVDLALAAGGSYVLTGDNGCGKTTLLRIVAGLETANGGMLRFRSATIDLGHYPEALRREVVYVHQQPYLFNTTIAHNIAYGLKMRGVPKRRRELLVEEAIVWAGVGHLGSVLPHKLSGGEKQRVALARAKVLNPGLLLLDEPTANLDNDARRQTLALIEALRHEDVTVMIASHDREIIAMPHVERLHLEAGHVRAL